MVESYLRRILVSIIAFEGILFHAQSANSFDASRFCFFMPLILKIMCQPQDKDKTFS